MSGSIKAHCSSVTSLGYLWVRIPTTYEKHPLWDRLLGLGRIFSVNPAGDALGIEFAGKVKVPQGFGFEEGEWSFAQLVTPARFRTTERNVSEAFEHNGVTGLDNRYPYAGREGWLPTGDDLGRVADHPRVDPGLPHYELLT